MAPTGPVTSERREQIIGSGVSARADHRILARLGLRLVKLGLRSDAGIWAGGEEQIVTAEGLYISLNGWFGTDAVL